MSDSTTGTAAATDSTTAPQAPATAATGAQQAATTPAETNKVEDLPEWAQKLIKDTRSEAAGHRTKAAAAEAAQAETLSKIAVALGLKTDDKPDPAKLTEQLTAAQQAQRSALVELAVYKAAGKHSGDPVAILDSRAFLASVTDLDPSGSDFTAKVDAAIKAAVDGNPKLKATAPAAGASTVQHAGGSGEGAVKPKNLDEAIAKKMAQ